MFNLSKSKYTRFCQCPKMLWLDTYKNELAVVDESALQRFEEGRIVGELAKGLLGKYVDVTALTDNGNIDIPKMLNNTKIFLAEGCENICEAAFSIDNCYCAVDILHKVKDGYEIYEVKSSTDVAEVYLIDIAYQKYVLEKSGLNIVNTYVVHINNKYEKKGDIDVTKLFKIVNVNKEILPHYEKVKDNITYAKNYIEQKEEPSCRLGVYCNSPYSCNYFNYCSSFLPKPNAFDLYRMSFKKACELINNGILSYSDIANSATKLNSKQRKQIDFEVQDRPIYVDKIGVRSFLNELSYPLYFLDFETFQTCIPIFDGQKPFQQIPFQYSLHIEKDDSGKFEHKEFLGNESEDPRRSIAESLVRDIPKDACTIAYNKAFECARLTELAELFKDLSEHLLSIRDNMKDLLDVFRLGYVYNKDMGGSFSIKKVLPALFPNDPALDYHNLASVHNGAEATNAYLSLRGMGKEEREEIRNGLLAYCKLDTFAMVMIWQKLRELAL